MPFHEFFTEYVPNDCYYTYENQRIAILFQMYYLFERLLILGDLS